jgi:hypothetical protein
MCTWRIGALVVLFISHMKSRSGYVTSWFEIKGLYDKRERKKIKRETEVLRKEKNRQIYIYIYFFFFFLPFFFFSCINYLYGCSKETTLRCFSISNSCQRVNWHEREYKLGISNMLEIIAWSEYLWIMRGWGYSIVFLCWLELTIEVILIRLVILFDKKKKENPIFVFHGCFSQFNYSLVLDRHSLNIQWVCIFFYLSR